MVRKVLVTGTVALLALGLFLLTMRAGPAVSSSGGAKVTPPIAMRIGVPDADRQTQARVGQYYVSFRNEQGILHEVFGASVVPMPQGVMKIELPMARIHIAPQERVLEIRADSGTFVAPGYQPRSGQFEGNVQVRWYESNSRDGWPVRLGPGSPDEQLRLTVERAEFDLDLGQISALGEVRMNGPWFDFVGDDLEITYNELQRRMDRLEITRGRLLRLRQPSAGAPTVAGRTGGPVAPAGPPPSAAGAADGPAPVELEQYYRARLADHVVITAQDLTAHGDRLEVVFGVGQRPTTPSVAKSPVEPAPRAVPPGAGGARVPAVTEPVAQPAMPSVEELIQRPLGDDEVLVRWDGPLLIVPERGRPADLEHGSDLYFRLDGEPVVVHTKGRDRLTAGAVDYQHAASRLRMISVDGHPMQLDSLELGAMLTGGILVMDTASLTAHILGPGRIEAHDRTPVVDKLAPSAPWQSDGRRMPAGTAIHWQERMDMSFYGRSAPAAGAGGKATSADELGRAARLEALRSVEFRGRAAVEHRQGNITADVLFASMSRPQQGRQVVETLQASGNVQLRASVPDDPDPLLLDAGQLQVGLGVGADRAMKPTEIRATEAVQVIHKDRGLWCDELVVDLTETKADAAAARGASSRAAGAIDQMLAPGVGPAESKLRWSDADKGKQKDKDDVVAGAAATDGPALRISKVTATGDVRGLLLAQRTVLFADKLQGDAAQVEIFGKGATSARVIREDGALDAGHIVLNPKQQTVHVVGSGELSFRSEPGAKRAAAEAQGMVRPDRPVDMARPRVAIGWRDNMHFSSVNSVAQFYGNVEARAEQNLQRTRLRAQELNVVFERAALSPLTGSAAPPVKPTPSTDMLRQGRQIRTALARGSAEFLEEQWTDRVGGNVATRVRLQGPQIAFDSLLEQIQVRSRGTLLLEDRRQSETRREGGAASPSKSLNGRGATLFTWAGEMVLDAAYNDLRIRDQVQMLHIPDGEQQGVQIDCRQFIADLEATGGLGAWLASDPPRPELKVVLAEGDVRVLGYGRQITTDQITYTSMDQTILLQAQEGKLTHITEADGTTPAGARWIKWELPTNRIEVVEPGRTVTPQNRLRALQEGK